MMQSRTLPSAGAGTLEPSSTMLRKINLRATELDPKYRWPSQHKEEQSTLRRKVYSPAPRPRAGARRPRSVRAVSPGGDDEGKRSHSPRGSPRGALQDSVMATKRAKGDPRAIQDKNHLCPGEAVF